MLTSRHGALVKGASGNHIKHNKVVVLVQAAVSLFIWRTANMLPWKIDTNTLSLILTTIIHVALWVYGRNHNLQYSQCISQCVEIPALLQTNNKM